MATVQDLQNIEERLSKAKKEIQKLDRIEAGQEFEIDHPAIKGRKISHKITEQEVQEIRNSAQTRLDELDQEISNRDLSKPEKMSDQGAGNGSGQ